MAQVYGTLEAACSFSQQIPPSKTVLVLWHFGLHETVPAQNAQTADVRRNGQQDNKALRPRPSAWPSGMNPICCSTGAATTSCRGRHQEAGPYSLPACLPMPSASSVHPAVLTKHTSRGHCPCAPKLPIQAAHPLTLSPPGHTRLPCGRVRTRPWLKGSWWGCSRSRLPLHHTCCIWWGAAALLVLLYLLLRPALQHGLQAGDDVGEARPHARHRMPAVLHQAGRQTAYMRARIAPTKTLSSFSWQFCEAVQHATCNADSQYAAICWGQKCFQPTQACRVMTAARTASSPSSTVCSSAPA